MTSIEATPDPGAVLPALGVVIPARNEERRLARCLRALSIAEKHLRATHPTAPPVVIAVVLDSCTDGSRAIVDKWPSVEVLTGDFGNVGAARAAGVAHLLGRSSGSPVPDWIACTDADSTVPADWLLQHLLHARADTDLLLGVVRPDPTEISAALLRRWQHEYRSANGHSHVHGANMGVRASAYRRAGGFPPLAEHEDVALVHRIRAFGGLVVSAALTPVLTSARTHGRTPGGMAGYLSALVEQG